MQTVHAPVGKYALDIFGHILQVPFVDKSVYLTRLFISLNGGVRIVNDTDKAYTPHGEQTMNIFFDKL